MVICARMTKHPIDIEADNLDQLTRHMSCEIIRELGIMSRRTTSLAVLGGIGWVAWIITLLYVFMRVR